MAQNQEKQHVETNDDAEETEMLGNVCVFAKRATEAEVSTDPEPPNPAIVEEPPEIPRENIFERNKCLDVARDAIKNKNFDKAERFLLKAKRFDPELDVKDMLDLVQSALLKQTMVDNYISIAREAITERNYEKANEFLIKARSTDSNVGKHIQDLWKIVQDGLHNKRTANRCLETTKNYIANKQFKLAEIFLTKAYEADPTIDIKELSSIINPGLVKDNEIKSLIDHARKAIDDKEYKKVDEISQRIKIIDPEVDIKDLIVRVEEGIASISSTDDDFIIINDVRAIPKNDPTKCSEKSKIDEFLETAETKFDKADSLKANTFLEQAESSYSDFDKYLEDENSKRTDSENTETGKKTNYDHVVVPNIVSHKVTVRGDSHDVSRCIRLAGTALASGDLIKAERLLLKAERICPTTNARELLKQVEEAKRAAEAAVSTDPVPPNPPTVEELPEKAKENNSERNKCLNVARDAIKNKNFDKAEKFLQKAKTFDPELDVKDMLDLVQSDNYISIAREAITERDYEKANDFLIKAHVTASNVGKRIQDMWNTVQNGLQNKMTANRCLETTKNYIAMKQFKSAEIFLMKAYEADPTIDINELSSVINAGLVIENEITSLVDHARKAIEHVKIINPEVDVKDLIVRVQLGIAFISSTDDDFAVINDVHDVLKNDPKRYSEKCMNKAVEALKRSDAVTAETWLNEAKSYYHSMRCVELLKQLEALKKSQNLIPEQSFVNSNAATKFGYDPELKTPSYNSSCEISEEDKNEAEKYLKKGQNALHFGDFEKAEEFALKSQKLWPTVRVQGLIEDIHDKMKNVKVYDAVILRSGSVYKYENFDQDAGSQSLKKLAEQIVEESEKALSEGKLDEAEDLLKKSVSVHPVEGISKLFNKISKARTLKHLEEEQANELEMHNTRSQMHQNQTTPPSELTSDTNKEEALKCIKKAEEAFIQKDLDKSERWIQKASRMSTSEKIDFFLEKIKAEKNRKKTADVYIQPGSSTEPQVHNKKDAKKCIAMAQDAISAGDLNKAKHFLEKSNRLYPSHKVQNMINKMQSTKGETVDTFVNITDDEDDDNINRATSSSNDKLEQVQRLINQAADAMNNETYYLAEMLLDKANLIKETPQASELLRSVRSIINNYFNIKKSGMPFKRDSSKKKEAEKLLNMAQKRLYARDFFSAQYLAVISESFHPMPQNRKMIQHIVDERYKYEKDKQFERSTGKNKKAKHCAVEQMDELNKYKSERYIEMAEFAWDFGNFQLAEDYLKKSLEFYPTLKAKQVLADLRAAKRSGKSVMVKVNDFTFN